MKYLLTIVLLFSFGQARADFYSGSQLLEKCEAFLGDEIANLAKGNTCFGYIGGFSDSHENFVNWGGHRKEWCQPENITGKQLVRVVTKHLQENPQRLHLGASSLVANALGLAFPCE